MAMHVFKYRMKCLLRDRETVFWTMVFPLLLATMFHFAFGHLVGDTVSFEPVKVAVVDSPAYQNEVFLKEMLGALSAPGDGQVLDLTIADETEAQRLLSEGEVVGVITVGEDGLGSPVGGEGARSGSVRLTVAQSGLNQSILKAILDDYLHSYATVYSIVSQNPTALGGLIERLYSRSSYTRQVSYSEAVPKPMLSAFYALVAMACMYTSFWGMRNTIDVQADLSYQGARRSVAPTHKLAVVLCDFAAALLISLGEILVLLAYLVFALKVNFGDQTGFVVLTCLVGCVAGVSFGTFVGTLFRRSVGAKIGALIGATMAMSFLAGLMVVDMKHWVARNAPVLTYINPAALISDAFYSLYVYDNHNRFFLNIGLLLAISTAFCFVSYLQLRRERYASL